MAHGTSIAVIFAVAAGIALSVNGTARASFVPALEVNEPGKVLVIDGLDANMGVRTFNIDATFPLSRLDFGFVGDQGFTPIALRPVGEASLFGTYTFAGGSIVDFALRDTRTGDVFALSDPRDFANQQYFSPIDPSKSVKPVVPFTYYNMLVLQWDLNRDGFAVDTDIGFTITKATNPYDGFAPAPVPLPAAALLFGSGLLTLLGIAGKKRA